MSRELVADAFIRVILPNEGGVAQVPGESWVTYYGQTPAWLRTWGLPQPRNAGEALDNYLRWAERLKLTAIADPDADDTSDALLIAVLDFAVHSGHVAAIKALQRILGVQADGRVGPRTRSALDAHILHRDHIAMRLLTARLRFMGETITKNPSKARYAKNWMRRVTEQIDAIGEAR
jgi:lysozyme family protein